MHHLLVVLPDLIELGQLRLHQLLYGGLVPHDEALLGEAVLGVLQQLSECDAQAPRVRLVSLETLDEDPGDLLLHTLLSYVVIQVKHHPGVEVCVAIDVSELVDDGVEEAHAGLRRQLLDDLLKDLVAFLLKRLLLGVVLVSAVLDIECDSIKNA